MPPRSHLITHHDSPYGKKHEKKPEIVVYSSSFAHENEIKTQVKEMNTSISEVGIAGPNLDVQGVLRAKRLTLESSMGTMHVNAKTISRKLQLDGKVFPLEGPSPRPLCVQFDGDIVHLGVDGGIGESNEKENRGHMKSQTMQVSADTLSLRISGSLANYGRICSKEKLEIHLGGSLLSLVDGTFDSAGRGYSALKQIRGVSRSSSSGSAPSSSSLESAISQLDTASAARLIEDGVDLRDKASETWEKLRGTVRTKRLSLRQTAIQKYHEKKEESKLNKVRENITLINALFTVHDWKRGSITSNVICAVIGKNCEDCAQFNAKELQLKVGGSGKVEKDSIWHCQWVEVETGGDFTFSGQVKQRTLILNSGGSIKTTNDAIISEEIFARMQCKSFDCDGIWSVGENFVLDAIEDSTFGQNSYIESEKLEVASGGALFVHGSWQIGGCWTSVGGATTIGAAAKIFVEENATFGARRLLCHGFCNVSELCDIQVKESANFFSNSKLECHSLKLICEEHCTLGGLWIADTIIAYVRQDLISTSTSKTAVFSAATVTAGAFRNDALWQSEKSLCLTVGTMEQSEDGTLFAKTTLDMTVHSEAEGAWHGRIIASKATISCLKSCQFDGFLRANEAEVMLPYPGESRLHATGQWDILAGPLTIKGNSLFDPPCPRRRHPSPSFVLSGRLSASAIIAPFAAVHIEEEAVVRLAGLAPSGDDASFNILVSCGSLTTGKGSTILSLSRDADEEGIICAATWYHEGQVRFAAEKVHILVNSWVNKGRITNTEGKQNHVKNCAIIVDELLLNKGTIACDILRIDGQGILENRSRLFANDIMHIQLANFHNDEGIMESKNSMRLLSATRDWTRLGGAVKAKKNFDLCAHKLELAVKDASALSRDDRLSFSARDSLLLATPLLDEGRRLSLGCAARSDVTIQAAIEIDRLEVLLGGSLPSSDPVRLVVGQNGDVIVTSLIFSGQSKELQLIVDGSLRCQRIKVPEGFQRVTVAGSGHIEIGTIQAENSAVTFELYQIITLGDITAKSVRVEKDSMFRLQPSAESETTTMVCESFTVDGTAFIEGKLFVAASQSGDLSICGPIIGSSSNSELSIEGSRLRLAGQMANLRFLEVYSKENCIAKDVKLKNIGGLAVDCLHLCLQGDLSDCVSSVINCESAEVGGVCRSSAGGDSIAVFATTVNSTMDYLNMGKVSFGCRRSVSIAGSMSRVAEFDVDCKWLTSSAHFADCRTVSFSAWSMTISGDISCQQLNATALGVFICNASLTCSSLKVVAPFVLCLQGALPPSAEVHSLVLLAESMKSHPKGVSYLSLSFDSEENEKPKISQSENNSWKETVAMLRERFNGAAIDVDEVLLGLKYLGDLVPLSVRLPADCQLLSDLRSIGKRSESAGCMTEIVTAIGQQRTRCTVSQSQESKKKDKRREESQLYDCLSRFRSSKYAREPRCSSDADGGYASRSSSEDLDGKEDRRSSPSSPLSAASPLFDASHLEELEKILEETSHEGNSMLTKDLSFQEEEELAEFEELEAEIEDGERGVVRTDFVICRDQRILLARLKKKTNSVLSPRPRAQFPLQRAPSSNDLVMKRFKVKHTLSSMDLRSFGSESSLVSLDFNATGDIGSPMQFPTSPFQRSRIPRGSFRSPRKMSAV